MMNLASYLVSGLAAITADPSQEDSGFLVETVASGLESNITPPGSHFDLSGWHLQLPYSDSGSFTSGSPKEVDSKELTTFSKENIFWLDSSLNMVMKTPVKGVTTGGSSHPRVELRECCSSKLWGQNDGKTHTMTVTATVTHLTKESA
jgi:hypothetical protein